MTDLIVQYKHGVGKHFEIIKYPDGQQNVKLDMEYFNDCKVPVVIKCSVRSFSELEVLLALVAAIRKHDYHIREIDFMYLLGMRSDRAFEPGMPNYFRDVIAPIIKSLDIYRVDFVAPHSLLSLETIYRAGIHASAIKYDFHSTIVVGGDQSANHDEFMFWQQCRMPYHFIKKRRSDGTIEVILNKAGSEYINAAADHMPILIYDDLCDGGATFIAEAEYLKQYFPERKRYLFVVHGLFTKGIEHVAAHFDKIITTNSYQEFAEHPKLGVLDVWN